MELKNNQYLGNGFSAWGGDLQVLLTYDDGKIKDLEVIKENETPGFGDWALDEMPDRIIAANSADVDAVTGATDTSRAIKDATKDALKKCQNN